MVGVTTFNLATALPRISSRPRTSTTSSPTRPSAWTPPSVSEAGTSGHCAEPALELGHHQTEGRGQMDLLLSLCHFGCLQPVCGRLDGGASRECGVGQAADC